MAPLEPHVKVLVSKDFLETDHGEIACEDCHGGDANAKSMESAHAGMVADPSYPNARAACGECHEEEVALNETSVHYTLAPFKKTIHQRASDDPAVLSKIAEGMDNNCSACHASCGECHISRPNASDGGFIAGHNFSAKPDMNNQCTACHGSRVGSEYLGESGKGDVHYTKKDMDCMACHGAQDLHGDGRTDHRDRYEVDNLTKCSDCHELDDTVEQHALHGDKVSCNVCHSQPYANCYFCHVGKDSKGLPYYKNEAEKELLKIGFNSNPNQSRPAKWVLLRRVPVSQKTFDFYQKDALKNFKNLPTWKYAAPHNIQRKTVQNRQCNNCHGNEEIFLMEKDVENPEANRSVLVPAEQIPEKREETVQKKKKKRKNFF